MALSPVARKILDQEFQISRLAAPRKNLWRVIEIVNHFAQGGNLQIQSANLERAIKRMGWGRYWDSTSGKDTYGLQRALGDLLGNHGLKLPKAGRVKGGYVYRVPKDGINDAYLVSVGLDPVLVRQQRIDQAIVNAVEHRRPIKFHYQGDPEDSYRVLDPHVYVENQHVQNVHGKQVRGYSRTAAELPAWRCFHLDSMCGIEVLHSETFSPCASYNPDCTKYINAYAQI